MAELLKDNIEGDKRRSLQWSTAAAVCSLMSGKAGGR